MKLLKGLVISLFVAVLVFSAVPSFAGCGLDHGSSDGQTLMDASAALEGTNPELAAKVKELALKSYPEAKAAAAEHPGN